MKKEKRVLLVGRPNVGKSVVFNNITDSYAVVSNYPGTTVEITTGKVRGERCSYQVIDTPGIYSLIPFSAEEEVTLKILFEETPDLIVQVIEAKNIEKMLPLSLLLLEVGFPLILAVNMLDEAWTAGMDLNLSELEKKLNIPVIGTISTRGKGMVSLKKTIEKKLIRGKEKAKTGFKLPYSREVEEPVQEMVKRQNAAKELLKDVIIPGKGTTNSLKEKLNYITMHPLWGIPFLALVLYYGLYKFVGVMGAGVMVDYIDGHIFKGYLLPPLNDLAAFIPYSWLKELLFSQYGFINLGLRYGLAIILPIVTAFFFFFSIIEDSGYLPRLAMLLDTLFKKFGLNGRSVIPLILGLGCGTMAVVAARTLETRRERFIATLLLSIGIPCSAQLGLILAMLSQEPGALVLWGTALLVVLMGTGYFADKVLPGKSPGFYMEIPALRVPNIKALLSKTFARIKWYMKEIIPLFLLVSLVMWAASYVGLLNYLTGLTQPLLQVIGLPPELAPVFILGFFRRDYGAAGLYDLIQGGSLSADQLVVASLTLSLFLPCVAQYIMVIKEQGLSRGIVILFIVLLLAFCAGYFLNLLLSFII